MKVQIFIPTFNRADKLREALHSALAQNCEDLEVVVLDNHSTDGTPAMMQAVQANERRVRYIRRAENIGMIANYNSIAALVDGDYFSVLADDDRYEPCFVETALRHFSHDRRVRFVACNAETVVGGKVLKRQLDHWREGFYPAGSAVAKCVLGHYPLITNCLFHSSLRDEFHFHNELGNVGDGFLLATLFACHDGYVSKVITGIWNNDGTNASSLQKFDPFLLVDTAVHEVRLYESLRTRCGIPRRVLALVRLKLYLTVLIAADHTRMSELAAGTIMHERVSLTGLRVLRFLDRARLARLGLFALHGLRRLNVAVIALQDRFRKSNKARVDQ